MKVLLASVPSVRLSMETLNCRASVAAAAAAEEEGLLNQVVPITNCSAAAVDLVVLPTPVSLVPVTAAAAATDSNNRNDDDDTTTVAVFNAATVAAGHT